MSGLVEIMAAPLAACVVLTGIHAYLGLHVLLRGVVFVDLALAQVAALGATVALLRGHEAGDAATYAWSLGFALGGAGMFTLTRLRSDRVPQEAIIGIVYAVTAAAAILLVDQAPHGGEHVKTLLVGQLLWVGWSDVAWMACLYAILGALHYACRRPLLAVSADPVRAATDGLRVRWWDLFFYGTFAVVVTSSVAIAGVLLVFAFLIVPAVVGALLFQDVRSRILAGWSVGAVVSLLGCILSYSVDLPTGATIVCAFGGAAVLGGVASAGLGRKA